MLRQSREITIRQRTDAACDLQDELRALEHDMAAIMSRTSAFYGSLIKARADAALRDTIGHDVLVSISAATGGVTSSMSHVIEAHRQLRQLGQKLGVQITAVGDEEDSGEITRPKAVQLVA